MSIKSGNTRLARHPPAKRKHRLAAAALAAGALLTQVVAPVGAATNDDLPGHLPDGVALSRYIPEGAAAALADYTLTVCPEITDSVVRLYQAYF